MPFIAPIIVGFAALIGTSVAVAGAILGTIVSTALSFTLGAIARALEKHPTQADFANDAANRLITTKQPIAPWRVIYGLVRVGGVITFMHLTGAANEVLHMVITLCGHEIDRITGYYIDGVLLPVDANLVPTDPKWKSNIHFDMRNGTADQPVYVALNQALPTIWTVNHRQRGRASIYAQLTFDDKLFPNGVPNMTVDVRGKKVYDPRTDTVAWSNNSALCILDYMTSDDYGLGATWPDDFIVDDWLAAINLCDEMVDSIWGGAPERRYTCNGMFETSNVPEDVITTLLSSCAGRLTYSGGKWGLYPAAWRAPDPAAGALTDDDYHDTITMDAKVSRREIFNGVKGVFASPENKYQPADFPAYQSAAYIDEDSGEVIWKDVSLPFTTSKSTAVRLAKIELERARRQMTLRTPCKLTAYRFAPQDVLTVTRPHFGFDAKPFEVTQQDFSVSDTDNVPQLGIDMLLRETDADVFAWNPATDPNIPAAPPPPPPIKLPGGRRFLDIDGPLDLGLVSGPGTALRRSDGLRITRVQVTWNPNPDAFVVSGTTDLQYQIQGEAVWHDVPPLPGAAGEYYLANVHDGQTVIVRVRHRASDGAVSDWVQSDPHVVNGPPSTFTPVVGAGLFAAAMTSTTAHLYFDGTHGSVGISVYKNDDTVAGPFAGDQLVTDIPLPSHDYFYYPYYDYEEDAQGVTPPIEFVSVPGAVGNPPILYDGPSNLAAQQLNLSGRTMLFPNGGGKVTTTASTTTSTTTTTAGDITGCVRSNMMVRSRRRGLISACDLVVGEDIATIEGDGWTRVVAHDLFPCDHFVRIKGKMGGDLEQTPDTPMILARNRDDGGAECRTRELRVDDILYADEMAWEGIEAVENVHETDMAVRIGCAPHHTFLCGRSASALLSTHNATFSKPK